jgi:UDP-glucose:(heptosyl)LPS alpha-1,3-glucosyltransferase
VNIGFVVHRFSATEGTGSYVVNLVQRMAGEHDITVYATDIDAEVPSGVDVVTVPALKSPAYGTILTFPRAFERVRRRHDIVHAQGWVAHHADVVTAHIVLRAWRRAAASTPGAMGKGERIFGAFVERLEEKLLRNAKLVIAPSAKARDDIRVLYRAEDNVRVIHHGFPDPAGVERSSALRESLGIAPGKLMALYVGDARKGLELAITSLGSEPDFHLLVASGSQPSRYVALARRAGAGDRLHWLGHVADLGAVRPHCDVLLHPTIYDTFGLAVAEGMADGLPVIVSRNAGIVELVTHRESGWIIDSLTTGDITNALVQLAADTRFQSDIGKAAAEVARARSWDLVADETLRAYREVSKR